MNYKIMIIAIALLVFAIIGTCISTGIDMREATVVEKPYEEGLKFEATQRHRAALGWNVVVPLSAAKGGPVNLQVYDRSGAAMDDAAVEVVFNRLGNAKTKKYRAERTDTGRYAVAANLDATGYWELKVTVTRGADTLSYDKKIHIEG